MADEKVGIYCRLSNEDRDREGSDYSESIKNQQMMLTDYAMQRGWIIAKVYIDDNFSGGNQNRPAFKEMISDCESHNIDIVLCKSQSRFSREMKVVEDYLSDKFEEWQVRFVSVVDNIDTKSKGSIKARQINGLINEWYLMDVSDNIRSALKSKRERGEFVGAFAPYGYMKDPNNNHKLIIDPEAAEVVRSIFEWYAEGYGAISIVKKLNQMGVLSPTAYKKQKGIKYYQSVVDKYPDSIIWVHSTITKMLQNEVYIGTLVQGRTTNISYKNHKKKKVPESDICKIPNCHEPIVSNELWQIVQKIRNGKTRARASKYSTYEPCPLLHFMRCKCCGAKMTRECKSFSYGKYIYATCSRRRNSNDICTNNYFYNTSEITEVVINEINKLLDEYYDESMIDITIKDRENVSRNDILSQQINVLETSLAEKENVRYSLYSDKIAGRISESDYMIFNNKVVHETDAIKSRLLEIQKELDNLSDEPCSDKKREAILEKYKHVEKLDSFIINEFIDTIYLCRNPRNQNEIEIHWKF